jgi:acetyl-CoA hydrolase
VADGSTVQVGLGSLPNAVLAGLHDHNDLGVHSGLIVDEVAPLMQSGVVTNSRKSADKGLTVGALVMGQRSLFDFVDHNPLIALRPSGYTHDADVLAGIPRFTAINSALEVDLTGQINTESIDGRYVGAVGGALDFVRGAHRSVGGVPITVLASTSGARPCIVTELAGPASIPRADAGIVVTEYGSADLRGRSLRDRRRLLTEIAHPDHRERLRCAAVPSNALRSG